jgi:Kef-type K+ transport system membrane component KefB
VLGADMVRLSDPTISFSSILVIASVAFLAPILVNLAPRLRLPAVALEIVIGIVVGPSGLGWLELDLPVTVLSLMGLAFLLFLAGLEIDPARLRGRLGTISLAFGASLVLAVGCAFALQPVEEIRNPLFIAIVLASTSLGLVVPVVRDAGEIDSEFGQVILAAASIAEFGTILLVSLFFSTSSSGSSGSGAKVVLLVGFAVLVVVVGLAMVEAGRSLRVSATLRALEDTSAQLGVRIAILLLVGFVALAGELGVETILGAFIAGALLRVVDPEAHLTHVEFRRKVEAIGYGFLIPMFFVSSGARFDIDALIHSPGHLVLIPLFLLALLVVRGVPAFLYRRWFPARRVVAAGLLQATSLTFVVVAARLGLELDVFDEASGASLVAAGLLSVIVFPPIALWLLGDSDVAQADDSTGADGGIGGDLGGAAPA